MRRSLQRPATGPGLAGNRRHQHQQQLRGKRRRSVSCIHENALSAHCHALGVDSRGQLCREHGQARSGHGGQRKLRLRYDGQPQGLADGFTADSIAAAKKRIAEIRALHLDVVIIGDLLFYEYHDDWLPEDHPWWLRKDGKRQQFWPGTHRMDWYNEEYRHVVRQTVSLGDGVDGAS
jgi:hypothetical protein